LFATAALYAQSAATGDLQGTIVDATGAPVAGVRVSATNVATGMARTVTTSDLGRYRVPDLPAGEYKVRFVKQDFTTTERSGIILRVGAVATVDMQLSVAGVKQIVTISDPVPMVEPGKASVGSVVDLNEISNLPINGRNFLDYSRTVAGVTAQQTSGQGSGLSFNGQRGRSNNLSIDGVDNNGQLNGNTRMAISQEAVREFQVVTNQFAPEFGNAGGGLVNVISRSGTNDLHGSLFLFARDESLDARNAFVADNQKPPFRRRNFGGSMGGPIVKNKTFYFGAVEYISRNESGVVTITDDALRTINSVLAQRSNIPSGVRAISNGTYPVDVISTVASMKVDQLLGERNRLSFRYLYGQEHETNSGGVGIGGLTDVSGGGGQRDRDQSLVASWNHIYSPTFFSDTTFQYAPRNLTQYANDMKGPRITISGVATFGRNTSFPVLLDETRYQYRQAFAKDWGHHYVQFGTDIQDLRAHTSFPSTFAGQFSFASLADFVAGRVNTFSQGFGDPSINLPDRLLGFYVQDTFKVTSRLTFIYGLRYDYDMQPQGIARNRNNPIEAFTQTGINRDGNNFAPRFGLTWNPDAKAKTVFRAGYGIFYDKIFLLVARNALIARQTLSLTGTAASAQWLVGAFPESNSFPGGTTIPKPSLNTVEPKLQMPYAQQGNFGMEREISRDWAIGINYTGVRGVKLLKSMNINLAPPTVLTLDNAAQLGVAKPNPQQIGRPYYTSKIDHNFTNIQQVQSAASSTYHGVQLTVQKRFSAGLSLRANYTFSKAIDDASDFTQAQQPSNPFNARSERSLSFEDQRQRFTLVGVWEIPYRTAKGKHSFTRSVFGDWVFSTNWLFHSGTPNNVLIGSDSNGDGNSTDRPFNGAYELGRNTFMGPDYFGIDVRMAKRVQLGDRISIQFMGEAFNLQNRVNYNTVNTNWGTALTPAASFGQFNSANDPRQIQLGIRILY
jgi:hypothetical protein